MREERERGRQRLSKRWHGGMRDKSISGGVLDSAFLSQLLSVLQMWTSG
jgi:hypothetical protein